MTLNSYATGCVVYSCRRQMFPFARNELDGIFIIFPCSPCRSWSLRARVCLWLCSFFFSHFFLRLLFHLACLLSCEPRGSIYNNLWSCLVFSRRTNLKCMLRLHDCLFCSYFLDVFSWFPSARRPHRSHHHGVHRWSLSPCWIISWERCCLSQHQHRQQRYHHRYHIPICRHLIS